MTKAGRIGFRASFELFSASQLLRLVAKAEEAGFRAFSASDHFRPWTTTQGGGDQVWPWLGALALHPSMTGGTVSAPGQRYHPAVLAQAASTLTGLFGERFWWSVGSGEFVNQSITGEPWPSKPERNARLLECVRLMRALWAGEAVSFQGRVKLGEARLFGSGRAPQLYGAALSDETAEWVGSWADGLLTAARPKAELAKVAAAFRRGGGEGKPMLLQAAVAYAPSYEQALMAAHRTWPAAGLSAIDLADLPTPRHFDEAIKKVAPEDVARTIRVSEDLRQHRGWLEDDLSLGFDLVYLHPVGPDPERLLDVFGEHVLPGM
jgi:coenzyme F420-dependent glucose-6-phosphate dehydrogenase